MKELGSGIDGPDRHPSRCLIQAYGNHLLGEVVKDQRNRMRLRLLYSQCNRMAGVRLTLVVVTGCAQMVTTI